MNENKNYFLYFKFEDLRCFLNFDACYVHSTNETTKQKLNECAEEIFQEFQDGLSSLFKLYIENGMNLQTLGIPK